MKKDDIIDIISILLILYSIGIMLFLIYRFYTHSAEYVTHSQLVGVLVGISTSTAGGFIAILLKLSDFAKDLGEIKGKLSHLKK